MSRNAHPSTIFQRARGKVGSRSLRFLRWTWQLETEGREIFDRLVDSRERFILCFWHGKHVPMLPIMRGIGGCIFTSATPRGNVLAQIIRDFGFQCVQIPDRGGRRSPELMKNALSTSRMAGIAVDGPLGPYHVVKKGAILLASELDFLLLPASVDARDKYVLKNRWDFLEIPWLFTRVCLVIGEPIRVPGPAGERELMAGSLKVRQALESLDARATALVRGR